MDNISTHGIKFKDKVGYALGDMGGILTFGIVGSFQLIFYTDVLHISGSKAAVLILIARLWDAINDPMWGAFIDSRKPTRHGRFRPYILGASFPLALAGFLMFFKVPGLSPSQYLVYAYVTYIFYGMMYTGTNIPYGSLASVITDDEIERSSLSMFRSIGAGLGGLPAQMLMPLIVYTYDESKDAKVIDSTKLAICAAVLAVLSVIVYYIHFRMTKERVTVTKSQNETKYNVLKSLKAMAKNKEFVVISLISMFLIAFQQYTQTMYNYLFKDYFEKAGLFALVTVCTYVPMAIFIPFMGKLIRKFGKKEICTVGIAFSAVTNIILYCLRFTSLSTNPYVFLVFIFFSGAGTTFLVLELWAMVMDVIDYHELRTGRKEESSCYSVFTFVRKIGQTIAGSGTALLLQVIGYDTEKIGIQDKSVLTSLFNCSTIIPAICLAVMFVLLGFFYKFNKKNLEEMHVQLEEFRNSTGE